MVVVVVLFAMLQARLVGLYLDTKDYTKALQIGKSLVSTCIVPLKDKQTTKHILEWLSAGQSDTTLHLIVICLC